MKQLICSFGGALLATQLAAATWIEGATEKSPLSYGLGEKIVFNLNVREATGDLAAREILWERSGDDGAVVTGRVSAASGARIETALAKPGFVRVYAELVEKGAGFKSRDERASKAGVAFFDGGAAVALDDIRQAKPEPADFDAFWARQKAELAAVPMKATREEIPSPTPGVKLYKVSVTCAGPRPATGFLSIPEKTDRTYQGVMGFHGYGASWGKGATNPPKSLPTGAIRLDLSAHGFELCREPAYYKAFRQQVAKNGYGHAFDPEENAKPETAYFRGMALRVMRGLAYLKSLPEWDGKTLTVVGGSQGSLQAMWGAALVPGVSAANLSIPWCCDVGGPTVGRNHGAWYPQWAAGLDYFDQVNMARRVPRTCRVNISRIGLGDYIAPPCGAAIMYRNLTCPKRATFMQGSTHGYVPPKKPARQQVDFKAD